MRDILPALVARQIRIIPMVTGTTPKHICMRVELYGCFYGEGPMAYSIPQGDKRGYDVQFFDETFDGLDKNGTLTGNDGVLTLMSTAIALLLDGLGQLTDGVIARDDYLGTDNVQGIGPVGYDWVGWRKKSSSVHLHFHFPTRRNLTSLHLHTSNLFTRDIHLFHSITVINCDNRTEQTHAIVPADPTDIHARFINVSLAADCGMVATCLEIVLTFHQRSKWILLSEIFFHSTPVDDDGESLVASTTTVSSDPIPPLIGNEISMGQYWHWLLLAIGLLILLISLLVLVYLQWMQTSQRRRKLRK